jgi:hypothetical protein
MAVIRRGWSRAIMSVGDNKGERGGSGWQSQAVERDPRMGRLLAGAINEVMPERGLLPWDKVELLIATAPPVEVSWYTRLVHGGARPLRYALASMMMLALGTGTLAVIPAHSDIAGTVVLTSLPAAWQAGSAEVADFEQGAQSVFARTAPQQAELAVLDVQQPGGAPSLALSMLHVQPQQAEAIFAELSETYPALSAYEPRFVPVSNWEPRSLLSQAFMRLSHPQSLAKLSDDELRAKVLGSLKSVGLEPLSIEVKRQADGTVVIEIDAAMQIAVEGRTQEELDAAGLSRNALGEQAYTKLLTELEADR